VTTAVLDGDGTEDHIRDEFSRGIGIRAESTHQRQMTSSRFHLDVRQLLVASTKSNASDSGVGTAKMRRCVHSRRKDDQTKLGTPSSSPWRGWSPASAGSLDGTGDPPGER
jgi:hypothetical protein